MASITKLPDGRRVLQFIDPQIKGKRRTVHLGAMNNKQATTFEDLFERLLSAKKSGRAMELSVAEWIDGLDQRIADKFILWKIIKPRANAESPGLLDFVDAYMSERTDVKPQTRVNHQQARRFLADYLKSQKQTDKLLTEFTELDAEKFRNWMKAQGCSENYGRTHAKNVKMFFRAALRDRKILSNPFEGMATQSLSVPSKLCFVEADDVRKIMAEATDIEWRVLLALSRWGGIRVPSEIKELKWEHISWSANRITIMVPKLARYEGKDRRVIPLFPELLPVLREAQELAPTGAVYVLPRLRKGKNLRTQFNKFVLRAGVKMWVKPFMNMRSTRETELTGRFPIKTVSEWMGHDPKISLSHYQQVLPEHWDQATAASGVTALQSAAECAADLAETGS